MKKAIWGLVAVGAVIALRAAAKGVGQKMTEHCKQLAGKCKQMMAGQSTEAGMREHCKEMATQFRGSRETTEESEPREEVAAQV